MQLDLVSLAVSNNRFDGTISEDFGNLTKIENFVVDNNNFNGTLPEALGNLVKTDWFWVNNNSFTGVLPATLGNLTKATQLKLSNNDFNGSLPTEWGSGLGELELLDVSDNSMLEGRVPNSFVEMAKLSTFLLSGTAIEGGMSAWCSGVTQNLTSVITDCEVNCPCCTNNCTDADSRL